MCRPAAAFNTQHTSITNICHDGYYTTRGYANSRTANSRTGHLVDWSTHVLDKPRTGQLADATGDFACLVFVLLAASVRPQVVQSATCLVRKLTSLRDVRSASSSPRVGNPRVGVSASCPVTVTRHQRHNSNQPSITTIHSQVHSPNMHGHLPTDYCISTQTVTSALSPQLLTKPVTHHYKEWKLCHICRTTSTAIGPY